MSTELNLTQSVKLLKLTVFNNVNYISLFTSISWEWTWGIGLRKACLVCAWSVILLYKLNIGWEGALVMNALCICVSKTKHRCDCSCASDDGGFLRSGFTSSVWGPHPGSGAGDGWSGAGPQRQWAPGGWWGPCRPRTGRGRREERAGQKQVSISQQEVQRDWTGEPLLHLP